MSQHVIHPREEWIDPRGPAWEGFPSSNGTPYRCPSFRGWSAIRDIVIHYPGADWADMDFTNDGRIDLNDDIAQIRVQHHHYATKRKYSLGYSYLIGQTGGIWESRGTRNTNAANLGQANRGTTGWNNYSISIQLIVDDANPGTAAQLNSVNWLLDDLRNRKGSNLNLRYHGQGQATSCCGAGIISQINRGLIGFGKSQTTPPIPPPVITPPTSSGAADSYPTGSKEVMYPIDYGIAGTDSWWTELAITPKGLQWSGSPTPNGVKIRDIFVAVPMPRAPRLKDDNDVVVLMETIGTFGPCPSTFVNNSTLAPAWSANLNPGR